MAVPPKGAKIIFEAIFKSLKRIEYDFLSEDEIHLPGLKRR
jgi:hypothetical protein